MVVRELLRKVSVHDAVIRLGEVEITDHLTEGQLNMFKAGLLSVGLEMLEDMKYVLIAQIKKVIVELIREEAGPTKMNFSVYLSKKLNYEYSYMANIFAEVEGTNVERYLINHKIERVKELLAYNKLSLTEISFKLNYSSVAHLCNQFKKVTGITPSGYKKSLEELYLKAG
jgi:AraC-like DNA-binding protein